MTARPADHIAAPADFDPRACPIIARHYFAVPPNWRSVGEIAAEIVERLAPMFAADDDHHEAA